MKILHYISASGINGTSAVHYVNALVRATSRVAESYVVTEKDLGKSVMAFRNGFLGRIKSVVPDIVHVHGAWDFRTAFVESMARHRGIFTVVSPHGGLSPAVMDVKFWKTKLPRIIAYQHKMLSKSRLVISISDEEHEDIRRLGWKKRIILVPDPSMQTISDEELSDKLMQAYRKVIDTHYLERITEEEKDFVRRCLRESLWREGQFMIKEDDYVLPQTLSFRRIFIYAHDHHVTSMLVDGAKKLGVTLPPPLDVETLPRFKQKSRKLTATEKKYSKVCDVLHEVIPEKKVEIAQTPQGDITLHSFADIYVAIRFSDFDEELFDKKVKDAGIRKQTFKLLELLEDTFNLEEGFMPIYK